VKSRRLLLGRCRMVTSLRLRQVAADAAGVTVFVKAVSNLSMGSGEVTEAIVKLLPRPPR
jgi:hypothetical protein